MATPKSLSCLRCHRKFTRASSLRRHEETHRPNPGRYACTFCPDRSYTRIESLRRHQSSHDRSKTFQCPFCHRLYSRRDYMERHKRSCRWLSPLLGSLTPERELAPDIMSTSVLIPTNRERPRMSLGEQLCTMIESRDTSSLRSVVERAKTAGVSVSTLEHSAFSGRISSMACSIEHLLTVEAISRGDIQALDDLRGCAHGIDKLGFRHTTALHTASCFGFHCVVVSLLMHNADPDIRDDQGRTTLHLACLNGHVAVVRVLLTHGVTLESVDYDGNTPLCTACRSGNADVVENLLRRGAEPDGHHAEAQKPLIIATATGNSRAAQLLLESGANPNTETETGNGGTALHQAALQGNTVLIERFIQAGARLEARDRDGRTALHLAAGCGQFDAVGLLIKHGASINSSDSSGRTARTAAEEKRHHTILHLFE